MKKIKVLMVYPKIPITYWSLTYMLPFLGKKSVLPPLGLMTVAALMPDHYDISLIDMNIQPLLEKDIMNADLVFISAMYIQKNSFTEVITICNKLNKPIVAGGPYPISSYKNIKGVDYFVLNEAEVTLPEFLMDYEKGTPKKVYMNESKPDITKTPPPRLDIININSYLAMALQFSRGCPFNCEFCDIIEMFGRKPRTKTPKQFINEIHEMYKIGFRGSIFIVDDNFIGNIAIVKELLKELIEWQKEHNYPFQFFTEASIDISRDDELLELMRLSSFDFVFIGIETPDVNTLNATKKSQNTKLNLKHAIKKIQLNRIGVAAGFILGFDTDPDDIFDQHINFIREASVPMAMVGILTPMPNTQLYRRLEQEGRLLRDWSGDNTYNFEMNFKTKMQPKVLIDGYKRVLQTIYTPNEYFKRCLTYLERTPVEKIGARPIGLMEVKAFLKSIFKQTFSSYGLHYLRFLFKGLRINRKFLPDLITLAIHGHHFFQITREIINDKEFSN